MIGLLLLIMHYICILVCIIMKLFKNRIVLKMSANFHIIKAKNSQIAKAISQFLNAE